ncbi:unnamed protein product, partial [Ixodes persulcatus]
VVVLLCEYDALPNIGHACGHNLIAESAVAAGIAVKEVLQQDSSLAGKVVVLGTPAEEAGHGKVYLIDGGAFEGADVAMMVHPAPVNIAVFPSLALARLRVRARCEEKQTHAQCTQLVERESGESNAQLHTVNIKNRKKNMKPIFRGFQKAANTLIEKKDSRDNGKHSVRSLQNSQHVVLSLDLTQLFSVFYCCTSSWVISGGFSVLYLLFPVSSCILYFIRLTHLYQHPIHNLERMRFPDISRFPAMIGASTDAGNVSNILPLIHPTFRLNTKAINHTAEFADAARAQTSYELTLTAAQALSLTALEVMRDPKLLKKVKDEFEANETQK